MQDNDQKLKENELRERWRTKEGYLFRNEIIKQLQSGQHRVDWVNLKVMVDGKEKLWTYFDGGSEIQDINDYLSEEGTKEDRENSFFGDLRGIVLNGKDLNNAYLSYVRFDYSIDPSYVPAVQRKVCSVRRYVIPAHPCVSVGAVIYVYGIFRV